MASKKKFKAKQSPTSSSNSLIADLRRFYSRLSRRRRWQLAALLLLMVITALAEVLSVASVFPLLSVLGNPQALLQSPRWQPLLMACQIKTVQELRLATALGFMAVLGVANGLKVLNLVGQQRLTAAISGDISSQVYYTTLHQPYSFHVQQNSSDLIQSVTGDVERLSAYVVMPLLTFLANLLLTPAVIMTLLLINWQMALFLGLLLGLAYTIIFRSRQQALQRSSTLISEAGQQKVKALQEGVGAIREVLLDHSQPFFQQLYDRYDRQLRHLSSNNSIIASAPSYLMDFITMSAIALLAMRPGSSSDYSQVVPMLGSFALGARRLVPALQVLFSSLTLINGAQASLSRVLLALERPIDPLSRRPAALPLGLEQELELAGVWFRYGPENSWVLQNLNLTIPAKTTVAFVGSTGSGKSTTADLILGLLQPQKGKILVDGVPLQGERLHQWQAAIAHVPQQIYLSDSTLTGNIAFGIPERQVDLSRVRWAAKLAQLAEFIEGLPAGYDTYVGERGIRLSGGQRQRIGIARALYKNASVIVFDEATSALDNATEREVMAAIEGLSGDFTIILIAHRLSTVERCDLVVELSQGRVVAQGRYTELISQSSSFRQMAGI